MRRAIGLAVLCVAAGCSTPAPIDQTPPPTTGPSIVATSAPTASAVASVVASAKPPPKPPEPEGPDACPADMLLVDGDYCTKLKMSCVDKFEAPQNNLWVCRRYAEPTECDGPTKKMRYCIDKYEFPNRKGVRPMVMQNFYQAQVHCQKRGKRVCTETEWTKACEGPDNKPFPYGYVRDPRKCHGDQKYGRPDPQKFTNRDPHELERLWQGVLSGSQPECVSDYGVHDMPANADELAASETYGRGPRSDFDNVTTGGPWYHGVRNACRPKIYSHDESFAYYYLSWRCCAEADGEETEPRAPKQIKRKENWTRIVWRANNSWKLPFNPLEPGMDGYNAAGTDRKIVPRLR